MLNRIGQYVTLTIDEALKKAAEAYKSGELQDADRLYTAILSAHPQHPEANHGLGILAVGIGKVKEALPFLRTALNVNPKNMQFCLSYFDALIKLNRAEDARAVLDEIKEVGIDENDLNKLNEILVAGLGYPQSVSKKQPVTKQNILDSIGLDRAIRLAAKHIKVGEVDDATRVYNDILTKFPRNKQALVGLKKVSQQSVRHRAKSSDPPRFQLEELINLNEDGKFSKALEKCEKLISQFPKSAILLNIKGVVLGGMGHLERSIEAYKRAFSIAPNYVEALNNLGLTLNKHGKIKDAIEAFNEALSLTPDNYEVHNNMGNALQDLDALEEAIDAYGKALSIKPNYAEAQNNLGNVLQRKGKLEEAIGWYDKALAIKPSYAEAHYNKGNAYKEQGRLSDAIVAYRNALSIKPDYSEALENASSLDIQLSNLGTMSKEVSNRFYFGNTDFLRKPKTQIQEAIKAYLDADIQSVRQQLNAYTSSIQTEFGKLNTKDQVFCSAYHTFLSRLIETSNRTKKDLTSQGVIYHLGESHCLSYAHKGIIVNNVQYTVMPRITFGAKAFHFSGEKDNVFKSITKAHFDSLSNGSKVLITYGEIDCRPNEGFITAAKKLNQPIEALISDTVKGYVDWFALQNVRKNHTLSFFNVPAPVFKKSIEPQVNIQVAETVKKFNAALAKYVALQNFNLIDVYGFTCDENGFSNEKYHIDGYHLGPHAIEVIEPQLN
jgi:tetratricopeptide (TPR) repeat protein